MSATPKAAMRMARTIQSVPHCPRPSAAANGADQIRLGVAGEARRLGQQQPNMGAGREPEANPPQLDVA